MKAFRIWGHGDRGKGFFEFYFKKPPTWTCVRDQLLELISKINGWMQEDDRDDYQDLGTRRTHLMEWLKFLPNNNDPVEAIEPTDHGTYLSKQVRIREIKIL